MSLAVTLIILFIITFFIFSIFILITGTKGPPSYRNFESDKNEEKLPD
ncbi:hypothetical protein P6P90_13290 [Ectobacillus antri]|jgi:hypothetical protein|uniref:DUF3951 domain-containing protein n=1 Tax=Ectobacillus antri TaxID=2486280 RepID=A0ABT6H6S0_9BACI|nr:hypothetical protein [Ectobacillus antri]MDG4658121.1 hypothetical protein [Ectobacillus antri]MDG5754933.1 hypothetical protein [Ectobacillus antri]